MPTSENAKTIEKMYWAHIRAMSPAERVRKTLGQSTVDRRNKLIYNGETMGEAADNIKQRNIA